MDMTWKYKIDLKDEGVFTEIENERNITIPEDVKQLVQNYNAATPSKYRFMVGTSEKVFGAVLSFNKDDEDTVFTALEVIENKSFLPFAIDPFGNYICCNVEDNNVFFWNHETDELLDTHYDIRGLLKALY